MGGRMAEIKLRLKDTSICVLANKAMELFLAAICRQNDTIT